jgi:phenylacetate-CoA ligase
LTTFYKVKLIMFKLSLLDIAKHTSVDKWYRFFMSALKWDRVTLINYRNARLGQLLKHAYEKVPYYGRIFHDLKMIPQQVIEAKDLSVFPALDREIIQCKRDDLISTDRKLSSLHKGSSSGTTGIPIDYYFDNEGLSAGIASGYVLSGLSGWHPGQRSVHIWGNASSVQRWRTSVSMLKNFWMNQLNIPSILLDDPANLFSVSEKILKFRPESIDGYSSSVYTLARFCKEHNLKLKELKQVITTAENLENYQKEVIEETFAPAGDLYGCSELLGIASRPAGDYRFYVFEPHVIVETIKSGIEGMNEILVTDLDNYSMPLIRYRTGDLIDELNLPSDNSGYPFSWFTKILGRSSDIIKLPNGKLFHPVNIFGGTLFREFPEISKHKVIWDGSTVKFLFETRDIPDKDVLTHKLEKLLEQYGIGFEIGFTHKIAPEPGGKFRYLEIVDKSTAQQ